MLIHAGKYGRESKFKKAENTQTKHNPENLPMQIQQNKTTQFSHILRHSAKKQGGLILQYSEGHTGPRYK